MYLCTWKVFGFVLIIRSILRNCVRRDLKKPVGSVALLSRDSRRWVWAEDC